MHLKLSFIPAVVVSVTATATFAQTTQLAYWNLNSYNPSSEYTSLANQGTQAGSASMNWSAFNGTFNGHPGVSVPAPDFSSATSPYLATLPSGQTAGTGLGLNGLAYKPVDFTINGTGADYFRISGFASSPDSGTDMSNYFASTGVWSYSLDGTSFSAATFTRTSNSEVLINNSEVANQSNVTLRYQQYGSNRTINYDNLSIAATTFNGLALTGENDKRIVQGSSQTINYTLNNRTGADQTYKLLAENLGSVQDVSNGSNPNPQIIARSANSISGKVDTLGVMAGATIAAKITATSTTAGVDPVSKTINVQVLDNRTIELAASGEIGNFGRVVAGNLLGTVTLATNSQTDAQATRITLNAGTYIRGGLEFTVGGTQVFDTANESATVEVRATSTALGVRSFSADLKGATAFGSSLLTAEVAAGSDLSKVKPMQISGSATVIANRDLTATAIDLGREMIGTGSQVIDGSATVSVHGGPLSDSTGTRVVLNKTASPVSANGITANIQNATVFDSANETASVGVTYSKTFDRSQGGRQSSTLDLSGQLTSGEAAGLAGVSLDSSVPITVGKSFVQDRQITLASGKVIVQALAGTNVTSAVNFVYTSGSDESNTRITVNGVLFNRENVLTMDAVALNEARSVSTGEIILGTKTVRAIGEGLAGENPDSASWIYGTQFYQRAAATVSAKVGGSPTGPLVTGNTALSLHAGDTISIDAAAKSDSGNGWRADVQLSTGFVGNGGFSLDGLGPIAAGDTRSGTLVFDSARKLNGTHSAVLDLRLSNPSYLLGSSDGDVGSYQFEVSHVVTGNSGSGSAYVASGTRLKESGIQSSFSNSVLSQATSAALKDSETLGANVEIQLAFSSIDKATGRGAPDLISDTLSLTGLDGVLFVLQISYDESTLVSKFGTEEVAVLTWYDVLDGSWKNAIAGNSTYGVAGAENAYGQRFASSYDAYLAGRPDGRPRLNDFGYDSKGNVMWAVLDHNSEFAGSGVDAVPEPGTWAMLGLGAGLFAIIQGRRRRLIPARNISQNQSPAPL